MYKDIEDLIQNSKKSSEIKRGLAVKQDLALKSRKVIGEILAVTVAFISKWRLIYDAYGVNALMSYHKGGSPRSFLTEGQRAPKKFSDFPIICYEWFTNNSKRDVILSPIMRENDSQTQFLFPINGLVFHFIIPKNGEINDIAQLQDFVLNEDNKLPIHQISDFSNLLLNYILL